MRKSSILITEIYKLCPDHEALNKKYRKILKNEDNFLRNQLEKFEAAKAGYLLLTVGYLTLVTFPYLSLHPPGLTGPYWSLLVLTRPYWAFLGLLVAFIEFAD